MIVSGIRFIAGRNSYTDRDGTKYGVAIHNTANDAPASGEASYATRRTDGVSAHFYADDTEVIQSIDTKYRTGHAGSSEGNEHAVSVEITGTNDKSRAWWIANVAWDELGQVLAAVCRAYDIKPRRASVSEMKSNPKVRAFYSHNDMRLAWGGTTHTDPGGNFPWDYLFAAVQSHLTGQPEGDDMNEAQEAKLDVVVRALTRLDGREPIGMVYTRMVEGTDATNPAYVPNFPTLKALGAQLSSVQAALAALSGRDFTDEPAIVQGVLAGLTPEAIAAAIPPSVAKQVADELARRIGADPAPQS